MGVSRAKVPCLLFLEVVVPLTVYNRWGASLSARYPRQSGTSTGRIWSTPPYRPQDPPPLSGEVPHPEAPQPQAPQRCTLGRP